MSYDYLESPEVEEYVNKMYKESVKISSYMRWISILQSIKQYKDDNYVFNVELEKTDGYDNFDDVVNYRTRVNITKPNGIITDFRFNGLYTIHTRDDSEWGSFNKILNRMTKLIHTDYMNNLKEFITEELPVSSMNIMGFVDIDFKVNPNMLDSNRPTSRSSNYEFVKFTPKTLKYQFELGEKKNNRIEKHPNYYITPIIKLQGEYWNYNPSDLDNLHRGLHNVVEKMKLRFLNLYEDLFDNNQQSSPLLKVIEEKFDDCCVCYETTNTYTNCNHPLCNSCVNQLRNRICPICRTDLKEGLSIEQHLQQQYDRNRRERRNNETFNGETKEIEQEQKEETVLQEEKSETVNMNLREFVGDSDGSDSEEEQEHYYNIQEQELYDRFILNTTDMTVNGSNYKLYYFKIDIQDIQLVKLFPTLIRNQKIDVIVNQRMGWIEISVEIE
jgi:hypothetical protein